MMVKGRLSLLLPLVILVVLVVACGTSESRNVTGLTIAADLQLPLVLDGDSIGVSSLDGNPPTQVVGPGDFDNVQFDSQGRLLFIQRTGPATGFYRIEDGSPRLLIPFQRQDQWTPYAAWSPDGSKGAWLETSNASTNLVVQPVGGKPSSWDLGACDGCRNLIWSPSGDRIAVSADFPQQISYVIDVSGSGGPLELDFGSVKDWSVADDLLLWRQSDSGPGRWAVILAKPDGSGQRTLGEMVVPLEGPYRPPAFSPDGHWVVWGHDVTNGNASLSLGLVAVDGSGTASVTCSTCSSSLAFFPSWSADGKRIAWYQDGHIVVADVGVWQGHVVADGEEPWLSPDGSKVAFFRVLSPSQSPSYSLHVVASDGSGPDTTVVDLKDGWMSDFLVAWSPDSRSLAVPLQTDEKEEMVSLDPATGDLQKVSLQPHDTVDAVSPDGSRFIVNNGFVIGGMDGSRREFDASPSPGFCMDWPPDGLAPLCTNAGGLRTINPDTGEVKTLLSGDVSLAAWSPDGSRIALVENQKLFVFDPATRALTPLVPALNATTGISSLPGSLAWSPDSSRIAFTVAASTNPTGGLVYTVNADGSDSPRPLTQSRGMGLLSFSPDGKYLAALTYQDQSVKITDSVTGEEKLSYGNGVSYAPIWLGSQTLLVNDRSGIHAVGLDGSVQDLIDGTIPCGPGLVAWLAGKIFFTETCTIPGI